MACSDRRGGTATFLAEERAILFMRYIRKQMAALDDARQTQESEAQQ